MITLRSPIGIAHTRHVKDLASMNGLGRMAACVAAGVMLLLAPAVEDTLQAQDIEELRRQAEQALGLPITDAQLDELTDKLSRALGRVLGQAG